MIMVKMALILLAEMRNELKYDHKFLFDMIALFVTVCRDSHTHRDNRFTEPIVFAESLVCCSRSVMMQVGTWHAHYLPKPFATAHTALSISYSTLS